ncbi:MAG: type II toxin-antitoxin system VapC family toxin [Variovorax sp.]
MPAARTEAITTAITVDASVAVPWVVAEQSNPAIDAIFQDAYRHVSRVVVPALWLWECANVLRTMVRIQRLSKTDAEEALDIFRYVHPILDPLPSVDVQQRTLDLAHRYNLTYYDASYLETAKRQGCTLATLDHDMRKAAGACGVHCLDL